MAYGNWAGLMVRDDDPLACLTWAGQSGLVIDLYKNYLLVSQSAYADYRPPSLVVNSCDLKLGDTQIIAERIEEKNAILFCAQEIEAEPDGTQRWHGERDDLVTHSVAGIGCYGYDGDEWVGIEDGDLRRLRAFVERHSNTSFFIGDGLLRRIDAYIAGGDT